MVPPIKIPSFIILCNAIMIQLFVIRNQQTPTYTPLCLFGHPSLEEKERGEPEKFLPLAEYKEGGKSLLLRKS